MYYSKIGVNGSGFTNQIFSLITSIIIAYINKEKVVVVDYFLNDFQKNEYTPICQILDIDNINIFLKKEYDIIIVDKSNIDFKINYIKYGLLHETAIDLTDYFIENNNIHNKLFISKTTNLNLIKGDPCMNLVKNLFINYTVNNYTIEEVYDENLKKDVCIDFKNTNYIHTFGWFNDLNKSMFENILTNIHYNPNLVEKSQTLFTSKDIDINANCKINVIHLRLEEDAICYWSKKNNMNPDIFKKYIEYKYIKLINNHIDKNDKTIILSNNLSNGVIDFLKKNNYNYMFNQKYFEGRELNAIIDFLVSKQCNNLFIGNFNINESRGSTFSYYITKIINKNIKKILIDLDNIVDDENIIH